MAHHKQHGFTLIELSIVLVIIGLIVGGILVGQDLIRAAEIRATIAQIEKYNSAVNTFRGKYNGIPGDLQVQQAAAFGLFTFSDGGAGGVGEGDGNGMIENTGGGGTFSPANDWTFNSTTTANGEEFVFWRHLSDANLIDGSFGSNSNLSSGGTPLITTSDPSPFFPPAKVGHGMYIAAASDGIQNYFALGYLTGVSADSGNWVTPTFGGGGASCGGGLGGGGVGQRGGGGVFDPFGGGGGGVGIVGIGGGGSCLAILASSGGGSGYGLTPIDAYNIDVKIDDGMPNTGSVYTILYDWGSSGLGLPAPWDSAPTSGEGACTTGGTGAGSSDPTDTYNLGASTGGTEPACDMEFRFN